MKLNFIIIIIFLCVKLIICEHTPLTYRLQINDDTIDLDENKKIFGYYKDHLTYFCSTVQPVNDTIYSDNNEADGNTNDEYQRDESDVEDEGSIINWWFNGKLVPGWKYNTFSFKYDEHVPKLNITCDISTKTKNYQYQFPTVYLELYEIEHKITNIEMFSRKYKNVFFMLKIGLPLCLIGSVCTTIMAYMVARVDKN